MKFIKMFSSQRHLLHEIYVVHRDPYSMKFMLKIFGSQRHLLHEIYVKKYIVHRDIYSMKFMLKIFSSQRPLLHEIYNWCVWKFTTTESCYYL